MRRIVVAAALCALAACGPRDELGVGEYAVFGEDLVCGAGGLLKVYAQPAPMAVCIWNCVPQRAAEPVSLELEFEWVGGTWGLLREVVGPGHCPFP